MKQVGRLRTCGRHLAVAALAAMFLCAGAPPAGATDFSVTPIRADLRPSAPTETITVTNHSAARMRVAIKLMAWSQDPQGQDVYTESADLVYFPRQMDLDPDSRKVVRVGLKSAPGEVERAYRLFIEEMRDPLGLGETAAVSFKFSFGVPLFVPPVRAETALQVLQPRLENGKVILPVRNEGTQHVRLDRVVVTDPAGSFSATATGWYSLARTARDYVVQIPADACRRLQSLAVKVEGPGTNVARSVEVSREQCS